MQPINENFYVKYMTERKEFNEYKKISIKLIKAKARYNFLINCRTRGITPRFIIQKSTIFNSQLEQTHHNRNNIQRTITIFQKTFLNNEISICFDQTNVYSKNQATLERYLQGKMSTMDFNNFKQRNNSKFNALLTKLKEKMTFKIDKLVTTQHEHLMTFNEDYCINLTGETIPKEVIQLLGLGKKFALPLTTLKTQQFFEMLSTTESMINSTTPEYQQQLRATLTHDYLNYMKRQKVLSKEEKYIMYLFKETRKFLDSKSHIYVINSDKGQKTILMTKDEYHQKLRAHLDDRTTYTPYKSKKDLNKLIETKTNNLLKDLLNTKQITPEDYHSLEAVNTVPPRIYASIKSHKTGFPIRPIVSTINAPTSKMAKYLNNILSQANDHKYDIRNSFEFKEKIIDFKIRQNDILASFDIISLFTNVNQNDAIASVRRRWNKIKKFTKIKEKDFVAMLTLCVTESSFFLYQDETFMQKYGLPMGSSLSGTLAGFVVDDLLDLALETLKPQMLYKYVDDMFIIDTEENIKKLFNHINTLHQTLKFTIEIESNNQLPFLDMLVIRENNTLSFDWYQKPIASGRILNWHSSHPYRMKLNIGISFANRVLTLSHGKFHNKNEKIIKELLHKNNFPPNIIKRIIIKSKHSIEKNSKSISNSNIETKNNKYRSFPYVPGLSDSLQKRFDEFKTDFKFGLKPMSQLSSLVFTNTKSKITRENIGKVYKINCMGNPYKNEPCEASYIGETKRGPKIEDSKTNIRIKEHTRDLTKALEARKTEILKRNEEYRKYEVTRTRTNTNLLNKLQDEHKKMDEEATYTTALVSHAIQKGHCFDMQKVETLAYADHGTLRKKLESMYIVFHGHKACNFKTDTQFLNINTKQLIHAYKYHNSL